MAFWADVEYCLLCPQHTYRVVTAVVDASRFAISRFFSAQVSGSVAALSALCEVNLLCV